jgi:hypothetical protein
MQALDHLRSREEFAKPGRELAELRGGEKAVNQL